MTISQRAKPVYEILKPHHEVLHGEIVEALNLADIYVYNELNDKLKTKQMIHETPLHSPVGFLKRTHVSDNIAKTILKVFGSLSGVTNIPLDPHGRRSEIITSRVYLIPSLLGGGKTHLLITLYHIARLFNRKKRNMIGFISSYRRDLEYGLKHVIDVLIEKTNEIKIVALVGDNSILCPDPRHPIEFKDGTKIYTPWGLLAYILGEYDKIKSYDETFTPPREDVLRQILMNKRVLILFDESSEYMVTAVRLSSEITGYSEAYTAFIRNLAMAVASVDGAVLVFTLPAEYREGSFRAGPQHPEYVEQIFAMINRVRFEAIPPLEIQRDIAEVLKRRLFSNIDSREVKEYIHGLLRIVQGKILKDSTLKESIQALYGGIPDVLERLKKTYPFHPYFIALLVNIGLRVSSLGMTRGLVSYVAKIIRYIYNVKLPVSLITTWSIPIEESEYRSHLISGLLTAGELQKIYEEDVRKYRADPRYVLESDLRTRENELLFIKGCLVKTIWLTTIPGEGRRVGDALKFYPEKIHLPAIIYDPLVYSDIHLADVLNALSELKGTLLYINEEYGKVFFTIMPDIIQLIRGYYRQMTDYDALRMLERYATQLSSGRKFKHVVSLLTSNINEIERLVLDALQSTDDPVLFIYLALRHPPSRLLDVVLRRNNIALLVPEYSADPRSLGLFVSENVRKIMGDPDPTMLGYIKQLLRVLAAIQNIRSNQEYLRQIAGETLLPVVYRKLKDIWEEASRQFNNAVLSSFRKVYIGKTFEEVPVDLRPVHGGDIEYDLSRLASALENYLHRRGYRMEWSWSTLYIDTRDWREIWAKEMYIKKPIKIRDFWIQLLDSPGIKPHITTREDFLVAIREGYEEGCLAFKYTGRIIWLDYPLSINDTLLDRARKNQPLLDWERHVLRIIRSEGVNVMDLEIIHPEEIIDEFIEQVKVRARAGVEKRVIRRLAVFIGDEMIDLEKYLASINSPQELVEKLIYHPIMLIEEVAPASYNLVVDYVNDNMYTGKPLEIRGDELAEIHVVGKTESKNYPYKINIELYAENLATKEIHILDKTMLDGPGRYVLRGRITSPGEYLVIVKAVGNDPRKFHPPEIPVAKAIVSGEVCVEKTLSGSELISWFREGLRQEIVKFVVEGRVRRYMHDLLYKLFNDKSMGKSRVSGVLKIIPGSSEEIIIEVRGTSSSKLANLINFLRTLGEISEIHLEVSNIDIEQIKNNIVVKSILTNTTRGLASLVSLYVRECKKIG